MKTKIFRYGLMIGVMSFICLGLTNYAISEPSPVATCEDQSLSCKNDIRETYGNLPLYFIENKGQVDKEVKFYEKGSRHATFFTEKGVILNLNPKNVSITLRPLGANKIVDVVAEEKQ